MTDVAEQSDKKKRFRSPPYPILELAKAIERTSSLMKAAHHHVVGIPVVLQAWEMESEAGPVWRYLAALMQYGLVADSGTGKARKFQVTDSARRIIQDQTPNSEKRKEALKAAALSPMINKAIWDKFGAAANLSDSVLKSYLTVDRSEAGEAPYSDSSATEVIQTYRGTLIYAGLSDSDKVLPTESDKTEPKDDDSSSDDESKAVAVGDYVQWTSKGIDQFKPPQKVVEILADSAHVRVFGSNTGIPMNELSVVDPPKLPPGPPVVAGSAHGADNPASKSDIN